MKYLCTENTYRYRPIMRTFYKHYERLEYWLYKEDIYNELKDRFDSYTLEDCERDLETNHHLGHNLFHHLLQLV